MRATDLSATEIEQRVQSLLELLSLQSCADTIIGNDFSKGLSGGELKRASIGYELITNPSLLLLDEPTSGLDARTAAKILEVLRQEARRGATVILSIH